MWNITISEWVQNCVLELVYEARRGKLWFLPGATVDAAREMDMEVVLPNLFDEDHQDASVLIDLIDQLRWSQVLPTNRILSEVQDLSTPFHAGGDWVPFNPVTWAPVSPPRGLITRNPDGSFTRNDRGPRLIGSLRHLLQDSRPQDVSGAFRSAIGTGTFPSAAQRGCSP